MANVRVANGSCKLVRKGIELMALIPAQAGRYTTVTRSSGTSERSEHMDARTLIENKYMVM